MISEYQEIAYDLAAKQGIEIGSYVEIIKAGERYSTYSDWAKKYNMPNYKEESILSDKREILNKTGIVIAIGPHKEEPSSHSSCLLGISLKDDFDVIINLKGVEQIINPEETKNYKITGIIERLEKNSKYLSFYERKKTRKRVTLKEYGPYYATPMKRYFSKETGNQRTLKEGREKHFLLLLHSIEKTDLSVSEK